MICSLQANRTLYAIPCRKLLIPTTCRRTLNLELTRAQAQAETRQQRVVTTRAAAGDDTGSSEAPAVDQVAPADAVKDVAPEEVFYEGPGSNAEFIISLLLLPTLFYAPLSIASIGRRLWISFKFTNKRMAIVNTSPLFKRTIEVAYSSIKEIRTGSRAFGLWGDMVIFLRDGSRIELTGLEKYKEIEQYINRCRYTL